MGYLGYCVKYLGYNVGYLNYIVPGVQCATLFYSVQITGLQCTLYIPRLQCRITQLQDTVSYWLLEADNSASVKDK
jgi:hypothetical protein